MKKTIVPRFSSSFCAWSMFFLDIGRDYVRSYLYKSDKANLDVMNNLYKDMVAEALKDVEAFNVSADEMVFEKSVEIRYQGQYHVLEIHLPETEITAQDIKDMEKKFHELHKELFTFSLSWVPMEMINLRLTAKIKSQKFPIKKIAAGTKDASKALLRKKDCYFNNKCIGTPV